jgi:putative nucleotidyltransferase with HDIG domain
MKSDIEQRLRKVVEVSTKKAAITEWNEAAKNQGVPLYNYRLDHAEEVVELAKHIAEGSDADMKVITLAAWLHDLAKPGVGGISASHHGIVSAEMTEEILTQEKIDRETIEKVSDAIKKHVGLTLKHPLEPLEAQILWEADKILKLGVIGLLQYILNGVRIFPGRSMEEIAEDTREFLKLATNIADCMVTERGRAIAQGRLKTLHFVSETLDAELNPKT